MKIFNIETIRSFNPCYDPAEYLDEKWEGTIIDLLNIKKIPFEDRLWVVLRTDFISEKVMRLYAVWCVRQVQYLMKDERSLKALDVSEAFANGTVTKEDLDAARAAARAAAMDAAWDAARAAAWAAAWAAAMDAAWAAAWAAAMDAAWDAARAAARAAAWAAAMDAAWAAAWAAQEKKLIEMIALYSEHGEIK